MFALSRILAACAMAFAALALTAGNGTTHAFQPPAVGDDIEEVVKLLRQKKVDRVAIAKKVAAIQKKHDLNDIMAKVYKPTRLMGIGYDPAKPGQADGIEKRLIDLGKKELTQAQLQAEKGLLLRAASYNLAMVEIAKAYAPAKPVRGKGAVQWNRHNSEVRDGTKDMIDAVRANDSKALKKAMGKIGTGCNGCHTDFRE